MVDEPPLEPAGPARAPPPQPLAALDLLGEVPSDLVVAGDFNSAPQWDRKGRTHFADTVTAYEQAGLRSAYHSLRRESFGEASLPTHWWRSRAIEGPTYHVDYAFIPERWLPAAEIRVGAFTEGVTDAGSDHSPLIVDIDLSRLAPSV